MRLIDADALIADLAYDVQIDEDSLVYEELSDDNRTIIQFDKDCKQKAIDILEHAPTIEPERKTGKWIFCDDGYEYFYKCSGCGFINNGKPAFCGGCGAKMEIEHE